MKVKNGGKGVGGVGDDLTPKAKFKKGMLAGYVYRVKEMIHPGLGISKGAVRVFESFLVDFFERICKECGQFMVINGGKRVRTQDVILAIGLVVPGELGKHARIVAERGVNRGM